MVLSGKRSFVFFSCPCHCVLLMQHVFLRMCDFTVLISEQAMQMNHRAGRSMGGLHTSVLNIDRCTVIWLPIDTHNENMAIDADI